LRMRVWSDSSLDEWRFRRSISSVAFTIVGC
jgi:hypothetical protein